MGVLTPEQEQKNITLKGLQEFLQHTDQRYSHYDVITGTINIGDTYWISSGSEASKVIDNAGYFIALDPIGSINITGINADLEAKTIAITFDKATQNANIAIFIQEVT